jgi:hypothetical protein
LVKIEEDQIKAITRKIHEDGLREIEFDRKAFKAGAEERQRKVIMLLLCWWLIFFNMPHPCFTVLQFLQQKQQEAIDQTERALESEFSRLRISTQKDLEDLQLHFASEERKAKIELHKLFQEKLQAEEKALKDHLRSDARLKLDEVVQEVEGMEREHKMRMNHLNEDLTKELEKYQTMLQRQVYTEQEWDKERDRQG